jgi:DNA-binding IclR family transcriptional regulator
VSKVQSVQRAFLLLQQLASEEMGVTRLAAAAGLPKSTVARLLKTLEHEGAVAWDAETARYRIGPSIVSLAGSTDPATDLIAHTRPHLVVLAELTGEDAGLAVPDGRLTHYVAQVGTDNAVQVSDWTGQRLPMHSVASGLAMLAFLPEEMSEQYLAGPIERFTDATMTDPDDLRARLARIRLDGFAWCQADYVEGLSAVAAPILDASGRPTGAIHVHGPSFRFPPDGRRDEIAALVVDKARLVSEPAATSSPVH